MFKKYFDLTTELEYQEWVHKNGVQMYFWTAISLIGCVISCILAISRIFSDNPDWWKMMVVSGIFFKVTSVVYNAMDHNYRKIYIKKHIWQFEKHF